ncbi:hypothetical protein HNY73_000917 [Argiope bruennichi]|uniref:Uncharacterized protein n=1 Tax=Argiope bruennichi TaxID=94029 RepID=A0A8T0FZM9_ARGBR|nr:hypothetical protein HNY73_000917 [Argiope bruennichi]
MAEMLQMEAYSTEADHASLSSVDLRDFFHFASTMLRTLEKTSSIVMSDSEEIKFLSFVSLFPLTLDIAPLLPFPYSISLLKGPVLTYSEWQRPLFKDFFCPFFPLAERAAGCHSNLAKDS